MHLVKKGSFASKFNPLHLSCEWTQIDYFLVKSFSSITKLVESENNFSSITKLVESENNHNQACFICVM